MDSLPRPISSRQQGAALIIVLVFVVLLVGLAVAYVSRTTSDRTVAHSSFSQTKVDELAASATNYIVNDLFQEIVNGSSAATVNNVTIYSPTSAANMLPRRSGNPGGNPDPIPNLVRRSWTGDTTLNEASAVNSFTDHSANDRYVTPARWNKHYLIPQANLGNFTAPDWAILTRNGRTQFLTWNATLKDASPSNLSYAVGRYAYAIYDEGGLLDANVAGYPGNLTPGQYGPKGTSAFADLTVLSGMSSSGINTLVGWRNYASAQPGGTFPGFTFTSAQAASYVSAVLSNMNGFLAVGTQPLSGPNIGTRTDQMFPSRQSLIQLSLANPTGFPTDSLQYLGTFSRELNAPSWTPTLNATDMGAPNNGAGNVYAYKDNAANPAATPINPNFLNVRVCSQNGCGFTRADGTPAVVGEPLIKRRFPLTRLIAITSTGPNTTANSTIINGVLGPATTSPNGGTVQRDFGLQWDGNNYRWNYVGGSGSTVLTRIERLDEVAAENREPNFFELLKAAILSGSVGMGSGSTGNTFVAAEAKYYNSASINGTSSDYQIIQIGANILSQWDSSNIPIFIGFGIDPSGGVIPYEIAGIKNLPYLSKLVFKPAWIRVQGNDQFAAWLVPSLWNPHQNAASATGNVRVAMTNGTMTATLSDSGSPPSIITTTPVVGNSGPSETQYMTVDVSSWFGNNPPAAPSGPTSANPANASNITPMDANLGGYYGFHFPFATTSGVGPNNSTAAYPDFGSGCTFEMQVLINGVPKTYQRWKSCGPNHPLIFQPPNSYWTDNSNNKRFQDPEFVTLDPRTLRFGVWGNAGNQVGGGDTADYTAGSQLSLDWPTPRYEPVTAFPPQGPLFSSSASPNLYLYANNADATVHYADFDSVQRLGDFLSPGATTAMLPSDSADRPLMLAGAFQSGVFQSVAELGHVFRDQPWKTLTFTTASPVTTARSADAGLLDVFTLHESSMEAGKTSLNTKQEPVLKAILSKAGLNLTGTSIITANQVDDGNGNGIVPALMTLTSTQPMVNKAELVTGRKDVNGNYLAGLAANAAVTGLGNKEARECVLRAFSDACQTRTWNLMIDVIAQSGRYPPNASSLAGFVVEGETHYWVHVAIDRFTGQVIDKQIEVVNE